MLIALLLISFYFERRITVKKLFFLAAMFLTAMIFMASLPVSGMTARGEVLLVWGGDAINDGDAFIISELEKMGFSVTTVLDTDSTSEMADGKALVYICESIMSANVLDKFTKTPVPVIACEAGVYDDMLMTPADGLFNEGVPEGAMVQIFDHEITAGIPKEFEPYDEPSGKSWMLGMPEGDVRIIAASSADTTRAVVFVYDSGAVMADGFKAPAKRAGFYFQGAYASTASADAKKLWTNLISWLAPEPVPETTAEVVTVPDTDAAESPDAETVADNVTQSPATGDFSLFVLIIAAAAAYLIHSLKPGKRPDYEV